MEAARERASENPPWPFLLEWARRGGSAALALLCRVSRPSPAAVVVVFARSIWNEDRDGCPASDGADPANCPCIPHEAIPALSRESTRSSDVQGAP